MTLYSNNCPKCKILEKLLNDKGFKFEKTDDFTKLIKLGFRSAPVLESLGSLMTFDQAIKYIGGK